MGLTALLRVLQIAAGSTSKCSSCKADYIHVPAMLSSQPSFFLDSITDLFSSKRQGLLEFVVSALKPAEPIVETPGQLVGESPFASPDRPPAMSTRRKRKGREEPDQDSLYGEADAIVSCPCCTQSVLNKDMDSHLSSQCKTGVYVEPLRSIAVNSNPRKEQRPKPAVAYDSMKDAQLRKLLKDEGLRTSGDKSTLKRRHSEWILRYNANLDLLHPKPDAVLRAEMEKWEALHGELRPVRQQSGLPTNPNHEPTEDSERAARQHQKIYNGHFNELAAGVRERKRNRTKLQTENGDSSTSGTMTPEMQLPTSTEDNVDVLVKSIELSEVPCTADANESTISDQMTMAEGSLLLEKVICPTVSDMPLGN
ncbi:E3 ubiquitin-protein ligase rad18 [Blyttiomyces sp. JEL0837]|nr:E3 ubiquitin-protein ligase rad18 [Blyttiomyces sp. JEL0837]